jgi:hypothetical protein
LVRGTWALDESDAEARPFPGVRAARSPLAWHDSLTVTTGGDGWSGFDAGLVKARLFHAPLLPDANGRTRALGDLALGSGVGGYDENALWLRRGDSLSFVEGGAEGWKFDGLGPYGPAGRHQYGGAGAWDRNRVRIEGAFTERGAAASLLGGEEQSVGGASGRAGVGYGWGRQQLALSLGRAYDTHESFGGLLDYSRRDARQRWAALEWRGDSAWSARLDVRDAHVARVSELSGRQAWDATSAWLALGAELRGSASHVTAGLGIGRHGELEGTEVAPSLAIGFAEAPFEMRLFAERVVTPVWSDLAAGEEAFLQSTWAGGVDLGAHSPRRGGARIGWLLGRTHDRAVVERLPLEDLWLRSGFRRDPSTYEFSLFTGSAELTGGWWGVGAETFALLRDRSTIQPNVDPSRGGRSFVEAHWHAFRGDLGVRLRGELEATGGRESEALALALPHEVTYGVGAAFSLADVIVTLRIRNLSDQRTPQTWIDSFTGIEALSPGREVRFSAGWRFFN